MEYEYENTEPEDIRASEQKPKQKQSDMGTASMLIGIVGIVTSCFCCIGIALSSLALILGLLTRTDEKMDSHAKIGVISGGVGLALSVLLTGVWIYTLDYMLEGFPF